MRVYSLSDRPAIAEKDLAESKEVFGNAGSNGLQVIIAGPK
jgi:hypothetical protein